MNKNEFRKTAKDVLEDCVDKLGLSEVLGLLADVCSEKADHILSTYNDRQLYEAWDSNAALIQMLADNGIQE